MAEDKKPKRPVPRIDEESRPFWEACARHELYVQKCRSCGKVLYYPRSFCPEDLSQDLAWVRCSGKGTVYTFTVTYQNQSAGFRDKVPYVMAYVQLEEGVRMLTDIVGCKPEEVKIGMPVEVTFEDVTSEVSLPLFKPVGK
ncbi:MAG: Zn-ribbon domain-containing OB-fold protein [Candidatus Binatia bacterium]